MPSKPTSRFVTAKPRKTTNPSSRSQKEECPQTCAADVNQENRKEEHDQQVFTCPEEGCIKSYQRYSALQKHLDCGKHQRALENETLFDQAILGYASRLEQGNNTVPQILGSEYHHPSNGPSLLMGFKVFQWT